MFGKKKKKSGINHQFVFGCRLDVWFRKRLEDILRCKNILPGLLFGRCLHVLRWDFTAFAGNLSITGLPLI